MERAAAKELYEMASGELIRLQFQIAELKAHPFRNLWNWLMGRQ